MCVVETSELRRSYRTRTGIVRRETKTVEAVRGVSFGIERGRAVRAARPQRRRQDHDDQDADHAAAAHRPGSARVLGHDVVARRRARCAATSATSSAATAASTSGSTRCDNLRYFAELYGVPPREQRARIGELLELVGLTGREKERVEGFSRGMRQRLHIARGLLHDPEVLFLDEPTIGIDPVGARELRATIATLREQGKTILLTTHYMFEADELCDRIAVIRDGEHRRRGHPGRAQATRSAPARVARGRDLRRARRRPSTAVRGLAGVRSAVARGPRPGAGAAGAGASPAPRSPQAVLACLDGAASAGSATREPTLEDAYVELVSSRREDPLRLLASAYWLQLKMLAASAFDGFLQVVWPLFFATAAFLRLPPERRPRAPWSTPASARRSWASGRSIATTASGAAAARALGRHPRAAGRRADAVRAGPGADHDGDGHARALQHGRHPGVGPAAVRHRRARRRTRCCSCSASWCRSSPIALFGFLLSVVGGALPHRLGAGQPAGVPRLAALRLPGPAGALPGLGHLDRLRAAADVGHGRRSARPRPAGRPWLDLLMCLGLGLGYGAVGTLLVRRVLRSARRHATLSLT